MQINFLSKNVSIEKLNPSSIIEKTIPLCETPKEQNCALRKEENIKEKTLKQGACKTCSKYEYSGTVQVEYEVNNNLQHYYKKSLIYQFAYPEVLTKYEEMLIYDFIGMIGSVGGTLGMFIGFSFSNTISMSLNFLVKLNFMKCFKKNYVKT